MRIGMFMDVGISMGIRMKMDTIMDVRMKMGKNMDVRIGFFSVYDTVLSLFPKIKKSFNIEVFADASNLLICLLTF